MNKNQRNNNRGHSMFVKKPQYCTDVGSSQLDL